MSRTRRLLKATPEATRPFSAQEPPATLRRLIDTQTLRSRGRPVVSVITVTYNAAQHLERAIRSLRDQTYPAIEHIVVDGNSTDGTMDIVRQHEDWLAAVSSEPDGGLYDAMNKALAATTGDIVGILNADDWYSQDMVERAVETLRATGAAFAFGDICMYGYEGKDTFMPGDPAYTKVVRRDAPRTWHTTMMCRREMYEQVGLFRTDMKVASDYDWQIRAYLQGFRGAHSPTIVGHVSAGGVSTSQRRTALKEGFVCSVSRGYPLPKAALHWSWRWLANDFPKLEAVKARAIALRHKAQARLKPRTRRPRTTPANAPSQPLTHAQRITAFLDARHAGVTIKEAALLTLLDAATGFPTYARPAADTTGRAADIAQQAAALLEAAGARRVEPNEDPALLITPETDIEAEIDTEIQADTHQTNAPAPAPHQARAVIAGTRQPRWDDLELCPGVVLRRNTTRTD